MLELTDRQLAILRGLLTKHLPGREIRAFGSRTIGKSKPHSDLDLVVMGFMTDKEAAFLRADLDDSDLPFRVDIEEWEALPATLREDIAAHSEAIPPDNG